MHSCRNQDCTFLRGLQLNKQRLLTLITTITLSSLIISLQAQPDFSLVPKIIDTATAPATKTDTSLIRTDTAVQAVTHQQVTAVKTTPVPVATTGENKPLDFKQIYKQAFSLTINGTSIYDIDNDGFKETIFLTQDNLFVHRYKNKAFPKIYEFKAPAGVSFVSIDIADMDNDSSPEFYISATNTGTDSYRSMVLEFTKQNFVILEKKTPYLMRITGLVDNTKLLIGQKYSDAGTHKGELFNLDLVNDKIRVKEKSRISNKPVHGISVLKNKQDNTQVFATLASSGHVELIDMESNSVLTASEEKYGGNPFTIRLPSADASVNSVSMLPIRLITTDFNNDGIDEIVCVKNNEAFNNMLETTQIYTRAHFEILDFEGTSMLTPQLKSGTFSGFISDLAYGDFDNNGTPDLLLIKPVRPEKNIFKKAETELIVLVQK
jgi:hypothetical protein